MLTVPPWEAVLEIWEHPPSTIRNVDDMPLERCQS
jgi:hypothetical protein